MKVGARFSPLFTSLFVSEVARRHRNADLAFNSAVSIAFIGAPSMAWNSMRFPPQSIIAIATVCLFCSAQVVQASAIARAPALEMTWISQVGDFVDCPSSVRAPKGNTIRPLVMSNPSPENDTGLLPPDLPHHRLHRRGEPRQTGVVQPVRRVLRRVVV